MLQRKGPASRPKRWTNTRYEMGRTVWQVRGRRTFPSDWAPGTQREGTLLTATSSSTAGFTVSKIGKPRERKPASVW